jgi:Winged helix DNA-binding domain
VERTLTTRELNRALLARQLLLERREIGVANAVERIGGLQTQYAPSGYLALWSRLSGFARDDLTVALQRHTVVQATVLRVTIHTVSARDYAPFVEAVRTTRRTWWLRATRRAHDARSMARIAQRIRVLLSDGPRRKKEIVETLQLDNATFGGAGLWIDLVRVPPSGTWEQRRADLYGLAEDWIGRSKVTAAEGTQLLVQRYLAAFGPASSKDLAGWAGLSMGTLTPILKTMTLRRFRSETGAELIDLPRAPLPDADTPAPVRFLPWWEPALLVHARRALILPEEHRSKVFNVKTPHSVPVFLVDGRVAGTWRHEGGSVQTEPFTRLSAGVRREVRDEAERLAEFMN